MMPDILFVPAHLIKGNKIFRHKKLERQYISLALITYALLRVLYFKPSWFSRGQVSLHYTVSRKTLITLGRKKRPQLLIIVPMISLAFQSFP